MAGLQACACLLRPGTCSSWAQRPSLSAFVPWTFPVHHSGFRHFPPATLDSWDTPERSEDVKQLMAAACWTSQEELTTMPSTFRLASTSPAGKALPTSGETAASLLCSWDQRVTQAEGAQLQCAEPPQSWRPRGPGRRSIATQEPPLCTAALGQNMWVPSIPSFKKLRPSETEGRRAGQS